MKKEPKFDARIIEAIEACRPGADDLSDPALAFLATELAMRPDLNELYERLQQCDESIRAAFADVPVPEGLRERILAKLEDVRREQMLVERSSGLTDAEVSVAAVVSGSRRWWLAGVVSATVAALAFFAAWIYTQSPGDYSRANVLELAIERFNSERIEDGQLVLKVTPPSEYPISRDVLRFRGTRWRTVRRLLGRAGVAYDMVGQGGTKATLYVLSCSADAIGFDSVPPTRPTLTTAGCATAAWQSGGLLYVLVVSGRANEYRQFLDLPTGQVT